jgi:hypothetical protein
MRIGNRFRDLLARCRDQELSGRFATIQDFVEEHDLALHLVFPLPHDTIDENQ